MNQTLFQRLVVLFIIMMYRTLNPKLVAFQKIVKAASAHFGKGGPLILNRIKKRRFFILSRNSRSRITQFFPSS